MSHAPSIFSKWQDRPLDEVIRLCAEVVEDPEFPTVRAWRETGRQVLGHFQVYFPEEIAHAAGLLPVKIRGAQLFGTEAESRFGSYLCSIVKTSLEAALSKKLDLAMFVTLPICDAARNLAAVWGRNFDYKCQILYLPQNPNSRHAVTYLEGEYDRLRGDIVELTGQPVPDEAIARSLLVYNDSRRLMRELYAIKREEPWKLAIDEAYVLVAMAALIPREEHNELLKTVIAQIAARTAKPQDRMRVVFEGGFCEQPPLDLLRTMARSCYVVDDDLLIGFRYLTKDVPTDGRPLRRLAETYIDGSSYSPVQHDLRKPKEKMLLERVEAAGADAVIVSAAKMCEPGLEEQVAYGRALDERGIPYFVSEFEENQTSFDHLGIQLETFVENLLFAEAL